MENHWGLGGNIYSARAHQPLAGLINGKVISSLWHFPTISEVEKHLIEEAMTKAMGNQGFAADLLGITRQTLSKRMKAEI